jgi:hypothetical protein
MISFPGRSAYLTSPSRRKRTGGVPEGMARRVTRHFFPARVLEN